MTKHYTEKQLIWLIGNAEKYADRQLGVLQEAQAAYDAARAKVTELNNQLKKLQSQPTWNIVKRTDLDQWSWEIILPDGENWIVTIMPLQPLMCGCGKSDCAHIVAVLRRHYSPAHPLLQRQAVRS